MVRVYADRDARVWVKRHGVEKLTPGLYTIRKGERFRIGNGPWQFALSHGRRLWHHPTDSEITAASAFTFNLEELAKALVAEIRRTGGSFETSGDVTVQYNFNHDATKNTVTIYDCKVTHEDLT